MNIKEILRWIGILPCALIGSILATSLVIIMCLIGDIFDGSLWTYLKHPEIFYFEHFFTPFITTAVFSGTFVYLGVRTAPKSKRLIAYALSIIIIIFLGIVSFIAILSHEWKLLIQCVVGVIVAGIVAYNSTSNEDLTC